jgi:dipeptidyl aminopeptidase/acylaminoacyl peptidase
MRDKINSMRIVVALLSLASLLPAQKRVITHEDVWLMKRVGEPVPSPDGKLVLFSLVEPDYDASKQTTDLWIVPSDGSAAPRRLTATKAPESGAVWSPDGTRIAFAARREGDEVSQIYVLALAGGEAQRVTSSVTGASSPKWRPDGKAILYESMAYPGAKNDEDNKKLAAEQKARKWNARIFESFPIRYWNAWLDDTKPHLWIQELAEGAKPKDVLAGAKLAESSGFAGQPNPLGGGQSLDAVWSPDGSEIVFVAAVNANEMMYAETETHLFRLPAAGGEAVQITARGPSYGSPKFAPDGKALYATSQREATRKQIYSLTRLVRMGWPATGAPVEVAGGWDRSVGSFTITKDSETIILDAEDDGFDKLFQLSAKGGKPAPLFEVKEGGYTGAVAAPGLLLARYGTSAQPPEIVTIVPGRGVEKRLTSFNAERLAQLDVPAVEHFWFTAKNGKRIHSVLVPPAALDRAKKYPLLVFPHGGPNSMSKDSFSTRWNSHLLTSPGYVLLMTNYTGSTGFGEKFADDIERDVLRGPGQEILESINEAAKRYPYIDLTRQAAAGASYGGYLMNWFNGNTAQFKCLVNHAGAVNNESQYGTNDGGLSRELRMGAPIWDFGKGQWNDQSPIRYSQNWKTPMLLTNGELDFRVPMSESMTTYKILLRRKVPTKLVLFPEEGHWILRGENSRLHMQEVLAWLKKYL